MTIETKGGKLFSTVKETIEQCKEKRNQWIAASQFKECLDEWVDLPERVYTEQYKSKFEAWVNNYIKTRPNAEEKDIINAVASCLHHETGNRTPYIVFNENEVQEAEETAEAEDEAEDEDER